ncbi:MAG: glycine cleavage system aminomethyltransferase GcvT [Pirellula sp.]
METQELKTPLYAWHMNHGARMAPFAGYQMPIQYSGIVAEHTATRQAAGVFDISHMGRLRFDGPRADQLLDHLLTRRVLDMQPGQVRYSLVCNPSGGILDDVLVSCLESPSSKIYFLLVVNASNKDKIVRWLTPHLADFPDVEFNDVTDSTAMIAIQGHKSIEVCQKLFPPSVLGLGYYRAKVTEQMSKPCVVSRTGYTGEDGFELIVKAEDAPRVWENLLLAGRDFGISPVGLGARDTLRLEAGMPLYGHELDESMDPYTAGLGFACQCKDRNFIGRDVLLSKSKESLKLKRVGLVLDGRRAAREQSECFDQQGNRIGTVTSGTFSPTLQKPISMAYLASDAASTGSEIQVDIRGTTSKAWVHELPFYKRASSV